MTGLEGRRMSLFCCIRCMLPSFPPALAAAYNFAGHPPFRQAPRPTIQGRTLTPQVKDIGPGRKAAAFTFPPCASALPDLAMQVSANAPTLSSLTKKPVLAITQAQWPLGKSCPGTFDSLL